MCVARWRCDATRERMHERREVFFVRHWESMPSKGQRLTRHGSTRELYCRFLLPLRFFSPDRCRFAIITLARNKENCGTSYVVSVIIINCESRIKVFWTQETWCLINMVNLFYWHSLNHTIIVSNYIHHCLVHTMDQNDFMILLTRLKHLHIAHCPSVFSSSIRSR